MHSRGFSLVEIMVVVAIVGVGAGIAVVNMSDQVAEARAQADGDAVAQRIQVEQRRARERMVGLRLSKGPKHVTFEDVPNCAATGANARTHDHLITTTVDLGGSSVCWEPNGAIATGGGGIDPNALFPAPPPAPAAPEIKIEAGIKRIRKRILRTTLAGPMPALRDGVLPTLND